MTICDFLIIGAMKAGTTSLYNDLAQHPGIFLPQQKEPELLLREETDDQVARRFTKMMAPAPIGALRGEASTGYTKRPMSDGCAERARRLLGPSVKLIYLEREPIARAISHYRHRVLEGNEQRSIDSALTEDPQYINYSRYDWQLAPWIEAFGHSQLLRLNFDAYCSDRDAVLRKVAEFLGIEADPLLCQPGKVHNSSDTKLVATGWRAGFIASDFFQLRVKPLFPHKIRKAVMPLLVGRAQPTEKEIHPDTEALLRRRLIEAPQ